MLYQGTALLSHKKRISCEKKETGARPVPSHVFYHEDPTADLIP